MPGKTININDLLNHPSIKKSIDKVQHFIELPIGVFDNKGAELFVLGDIEFYKKHGNQHFIIQIENDKNIKDIAGNWQNKDYDVFKCNIGTNILLIPIFIEKQVIGFLFVCGFIFEREIQEKSILEKYAEENNFSKDSYIEDFQSLPCVNESEFNKLAGFLSSYATDIALIIWQKVQLRTQNKQRVKSSDDKTLKNATKELLQEKEVNCEALSGQTRDIEEAYKKLLSVKSSYDDLFYSLINAFSLNEMIYDEQINPIDYIIKEVNPSFESFTGVARKALIGNKASSVFGFLEKEWLEKINDAIVNKRPSKFEYYFIQYERYLEIFVFSPRSGSFALVLSDITEKKQAQEQLQAGEKKYRSIFDTAASLIMVINQEGTITECNKRSEGILGYTKEELVNTSFYSIIQHESLQKAQNALKELFDKGYSFYKELVVVTKKGNNIDISLDSSALKTGVNGDVNCICIINDISQKKQILKLLNKQNEYLSFISKATSDFVDFDTNEDIFEFVGKKIREMYPETIILINSFDENTSQTYLRNIIGFDKLYDKAKKILGYEPLGFRTQLSSKAMNEALSGRLIDIQGGIEEISQGKIPGSICKILEKTFRLKQFYGIGFTQKGNLLGNAIIILRSNEHKINADIVETFVNQASVAIHRKIANDALMESERKFRTIFDNAAIGIVMAEPSGKFLLVNEAFCKLVGYKKEDLENVSFEDITFSEDLTREKELIQRAKRKKENGYQVEKRYIHKNGNLIWAKVTVQFKWKNNSHIDYILGLAEDITQQKMAQDALLESERKYREFAELLPQVVFEIDLEGKLLFVNKAGLENFEYSREDFEKGIYAYEMFVKEDRERLLTNMKRIAEGADIKGREYNAITKYGRQMTVLPYTVPIIKNNKPVGFRGVLIDITEIKEAQNALQKNERKLRLITNNITDVVWVADTNLKITFITPSVFNLLGYSREEIYQIATHKLLSTQSYKLIEDYFSKKITELENAKIDQNELNFSLEVEYVHKFGHILIGETTGKLISDPKTKKVTEIHGITRDVTTRKVNEKLQREVELSRKSVKMKQQFLANMSHEIRTPMTGIVGMIDFLYDTDLDSKQKDYIKTIKNSAESLLNILNDILVLSKIEAGKLDIIPEVFQFRQTIKELYALFESLVRQKELDFEVHVSDYIPEYIKADKNRLNQVISNLLSNAVKFTDEGKITINFQLVKEAGKNIRIRVEVIDTGIGINEEMQANLFETFTQVDSSYSRNYQGVGLGLTICKQIIQLMDGEIGVDSYPGRGSKFWFEFEAEKAEQNDIRGYNEPALDEVKFNIHVLLVEDKLVNQKVVKLMLQNFGCKVTVAKNGEEAVELFHENEFDLVLMDIQMPKMDGITAQKAIREKYRNVPPIIGLSANALDGDSEHYISQGMDDYIAKPVTKEMLFEKFRKWFDVR